MNVCMCLCASNKLAYFCMSVYISTNFPPAYLKCPKSVIGESLLTPPHPSFDRFILIHLVSFLGCLCNFVKRTSTTSGC